MSIFAPEIHRIHTRHLTGFHLTDPQPTPPASTEQGKAADIIVAHIAEQCHQADESGRWRNPGLIHALITVDLGGPNLNPVRMAELVSMWPWGGEFPTEGARDDFEAEVRSYLRGHDYTTH